MERMNLFCVCLYVIVVSDITVPLPPPLIPVPSQICCLQLVVHCVTLICSSHTHITPLKTSIRTWKCM
jgi:hypothetical protein